MEQTKEQIIADLYALRAGLSVISERKDEMTNTANKAVSEWAKSANQVVQGRGRYFFATSPWELMEAEYMERGLMKIGCYCGEGKEYDKKTVASKVEAYERKNGQYVARFDNYTPYGFSMKNYGFEEYNIEGFTWCCEGYKLSAMKKCAQEINGLGCTCSAEQINEAIYYRWLSSEESIRFYKAKLYCLENRGEGNKRYLWPFKERKRKLREARRAEVIQIYKKIIADLTALNKRNSGDMQAITDIIGGICAEGVTYNEALEQSFVKLLDPRDWQYLDLILYYFETGRADSLKEALQLVEREVQTQRIIGAIETASAQICKTIARAAAMISSQLSVISSQLSTVIAQQQIQIGQNQRLIAAADMQNALLAKANATSEQLMHDVSYIKNYGAGAIGR